MTRVLAAVAADTKAVILDAETTPTIDVSGAQMLVTLTRDLELRGVRLLIAKTIGQVRDVESKAVPAPDVPGRYDSIDEAVASVDLGSGGQPPD